MPGKRKKRAVFAVPITAGQYAPEVLNLRAVEPLAGTRAPFDAIEAIQAVVETLPAGAQLELDVLRDGGDQLDENHWIKAVAVANQTGLFDKLDLTGFDGARFRAKSGGTAGNLAASVVWRF